MKQQLILLCLLMWLPGVVQDPSAPRPKADILQSTEMQTLLPPSVYFQRQVATVQLRNSSGVRSPEGKLTMFAMVDAGGYSSAIRDRYQFYLISDTAINIGGKRLAAGAYGAGFLKNPGLIVMDLGGNELFHAPVLHDAKMKRPRPLQVIADTVAGEYRLYLGRSYVVFRQLT
jgi:hypothetical protein